LLIKTLQKTYQLFQAQNRSGVKMISPIALVFTKFKHPRKIIIYQSTMKKLFFFMLAVSLLWSCKTTKKTIKTQDEEPIPVAIVDPVPANTADISMQKPFVVKENYTKKEVNIPMRDGTRLFTSIYTPKDIGPDNKYPILMQRTCYSVRPYGEFEYRTSVGPNSEAMKEKYIIVYQDVRGRWMSEGEFTNMTPIVEHGPVNNTDESTDTYDTVEWLINNIENNNGKVGQWGISYPGFYATNAAIDAHPAMKAVSPQAPIGDFFFDDFHHNGAYTLAYWSVNNLFGTKKTKPENKAWYSFPDVATPDMYDFYLRHTPLSKLDKDFPTDNFLWKELKEHPNYDEFWQKRGIIQHLKKDIRPAMMIVGGWYDAEDLYGPLMTYKTIEANNPNTYNTIVMGPWSHGDWARKSGRQAVSNVYFGTNINENYQKNIESKFFHHFLKGPGDGNTGLPDAYMFDSGKKEWSEFASWPPKGTINRKFFLGDNKANFLDGSESNSKSEFVSDPKNPVPFRMDIKPMFIPRKYMADDQRQQSRRPDVLVFETEVLTEELTLAGPITADLFVSTTGTDMDWVVKVIDVYPNTEKNTKETQDHVDMAGYQQLVRGEAFRGRFRNSFERPEPFVPGQVEKVNWQLQDVYHTFKPGHKLMIQLHSSWFPYIDMNPQNYVANIFEAKESDFQKQTHTLYHSTKYPSSIGLTITNTSSSF